ncbi:InlB B-repeat-containing protein, partial [Eubacterium sp.]|uniref:InlB B-repeat-containing protein n=1 Tax=Eubacterium sp. TaxID=142586 RepID=UPI003F0E58B2
MKKRILSIILTLCMAVTMVPIMPTSVSAEDKCNCIIQCPYEKSECSVCASGGTCNGRKKYTNPDGKGIDNCYYLQNILDFKIASQSLYYFYLENDINLSSDLVVPNSPFYAEMVLDLNGHTINGNNKEIGIKVYGSLTIIDTVGTGKITNCQGSALTINDGGYVLMQGGTIEKCNVRGGVLVSSGGTFEMTGGTIKDNRTTGMTSGLPVIMNVGVSGNATFIMDGDAQILNDMDESDYNGYSVSLSWSYDDNFKIYTSTMYANGGTIEGRVRNSGTISSIYDGKGTDFRGTIQNFGIISSGVFTHEVVNLSSYDETGIINGGSFAGKVTNNGVINGGEFNAEVENTVTRYAEGSIAGGTFNSDVINQSTISGGTFFGAVDTENGTIEDSARVNVNFVNESGEAIKTVRVLRGQSVTNEDLSTLIDPTQYGYRKLKYTVGNVDYRDEDKFIEEVRFTEDETVVTVTLIHPITYTITYNLNGGDIQYLERDYQVTSEDITLGTPTKDGYVFTGWGGTGLDGNNNMTVTIPKGSIGDREYTAYYWKSPGGEPVVTVSSYTVIYDTQGGSPVEPKTVPKFLAASTKVLDGADTTRAGYRFAGWYCGNNRIALQDTTVQYLADRADNGV